MAPIMHPTLSPNLHPIFFEKKSRFLKFVSKKHIRRGSQPDLTEITTLQSRSQSNSIFRRKSSQFEGKLDSRLESCPAILQESAAIRKCFSTRSQGEKGSLFWHYSYSPRPGPLHPNSASGKPSGSQQRRLLSMLLSKRRIPAWAVQPWV